MVFGLRYSIRVSGTYPGSSTFAHDCNPAGDWDPVIENFTAGNRGAISRTRKGCRLDIGRMKIVADKQHGDIVG